MPKSKKSSKAKPASSSGGEAKFPRRNLEESLRIPKAILEQNAGEECEKKKAAEFANLVLSGPTNVEISSARKFGLLEFPKTGYVKPTPLARRILRPQGELDRLSGLREAVLAAPVISGLYKKYRGENLPDEKFLRNTATESFGVPNDKVNELVAVFRDSLRFAELLNELPGGTFRVLEPTAAAGAAALDAKEFKELSKQAGVEPTDECFVMMPFAEPLGSRYQSVYQPAIEKAKLKSVRADADIFGTGKIIDQVWEGIKRAKVLLAELTERNANVFYELGLAHAVGKPVVLVSSNEGDVPFDVKHVRVIFYDCNDPFWGQKLIDKVAENLLSALKDPSEATLFKAGSEG